MCSVALLLVDEKTPSYAGDIKVDVSFEKQEPDTVTQLLEEKGKELEFVVELALYQ